MSGEYHTKSKCFCLYYAFAVVLHEYDELPYVCAVQRNFTMKRHVAIEFSEYTLSAVSTTNQNLQTSIV